jgi:hypothetical protein
MVLVSFKVAKKDGWRSGDQCLFVGLIESMQQVEKSQRQCYPPFLRITKEMMSQGPQVADMECQEMD